MPSSRAALRQAGIDAAREARQRLARLLEDVGDTDPDLAARLSGMVAMLYGAEVGDEVRVLAALGHSMEALQALVEAEAETRNGAVAPPLSQALALLRPPHDALSRALTGTMERDDPTAPFLLTVKTPLEYPDRGDGRGAARQELEVAVDLEGASRFYTGRTGDLGRGGLFVASEAPLPVGTPVVLSFVLPDGYRVRTDGTVAWVRAPRYRPHELPAGMGVRFERLPEEDLRAIRRFLERCPPFHYGD